MKTIKEFLDLIDGVISRRINEFRALEDLELVREFVIQEDFQKKSLIEGNKLDISTFTLLEIINDIVEKTYTEKCLEIATAYNELRKFMFIWMEAIYRKIE